MGNKIEKLYIIISSAMFGLALSYAVIVLTSEKVFWNVADHITKGAIRVENYVLESKLRTGLMNYQTLTENLANKLKDPAYTFEQFKHDEYGKLNYELQIIHIGSGVIDSYKQANGRE